MAKTDYQTADEYIGTFEKEVQDMLGKIRQTIKEAVPEAAEIISYQLPALEFHGKVVYYSAFKDHYSLSFPPPFKVFEVFKEQLSPYHVSKSAVQFPKKQPFPFELMTEMVKFQAKENLEKEQKKKKK
ncbi:iron chaperone [Cohnella lupini]|uniref:Uncharacterized protein YdhG (YjbR/CyaY superfamily) n=1 Tax=Cohnella lupini TaxID=1294267 RepID=A0A3D9HR14_9BACL|nr:DUF1801 domain-containing protein [Cohnella lupini]RED51943.1 uncharacterized protein YdhG (YjbR/CyaY superfamily) [Cohnella lupini]